MIPNWIVVAVVYGCAAFLAVQLAAYLSKKLTPFEDGPRPGKPPVLWLIGGAVLLGAALGVRGTSILDVIQLAIVIFALVAAWYTDVTVGIIPDYFTLVPLAIVVLPALILHSYLSLVWALILFVPFAVASIMSKGRGMGWGDSKLAALGGALLGDQALIAYSGACLVAVAIAWFRGRRTEPIAFGPYLIGSICVALLARAVFA